MKKIVSILSVVTLIFASLFLLSCNVKNEVNAEITKETIVETKQMATEVETSAEIVKEEEVVENDKDIVIVFTNDIHCGFLDNIGIGSAIGYAKKAEKEGNYKALVDAGDFFQGDLIGTLSRGARVSEMMSEFGYDFIVPGNHEFDYGIEKLISNAKLTGDIIYSSNFYDLKNNKLVFEPYKIMTFGNKKVAFIGVSTPLTISTTTPAYYMDEEYNYIYSFMQSDDGKLLYDNTQKYINECRDKGADYVVLVGHMGESESFGVYSSSTFIKNLSGVDIYIDGHSHSVYNTKYIDKDGKEVPATETGTKMQNFGVCRITKDGQIKVELVNEMVDKDEDVENSIKEIQDYIDKLTGEVIRDDLTYDLTVNNSATGKRWVRIGDTNLSDIMVDAIKEEGQTEIAVINGGAIRDNIPKGTIRLREIGKVLPFGNLIYTCEIQGKDILDALENGAKNSPNENAELLHTSGITYTIDTTIPSYVVANAEGIFEKVDGDYRVKDVIINGEPLDIDRYYTMTAIDYHVKRYGGGTSMFANVRNLSDPIATDIEMFVNFLKKVDFSKYTNELGDGRLQIVVE